MASLLSQSAFCRVFGEELKVYHTSPSASSFPSGLRATHVAALVLFAAAFAFGESKASPEGEAGGNAPNPDSLSEAAALDRAPCWLPAGVGES